MTVKRRMEGLREKWERRLEMPEGLFSGEARLEVYGNRRCVIEGRCRICVYEEDVIRLESARGTLCFRGRELRLSAFEKDGASVTGYIACIEFS